MRQVLSVPSQLGPLLKASRKAAGLSQAQLAARVGISQSRMSHMELNPGSMSLEQLLGLFSVLGLEIMVGPKDVSHLSPRAQTAAPARQALLAVTEPPPPEYKTRSVEW